ncbi:hypothetical protein, partial [Burkholderia pseudomallei]|uniref:hypothetical protein n=1 Tax=Burkholderia pseudomallei TaxID=28450 RepID=UPI00211603F0
MIRPGRGRPGCLFGGRDGAFARSRASEGPMSEYKETLNLLQTPFPMKGDLPRREPALVERWAAQRVYARMRAAAAGRP